MNLNLGSLRIGDIKRLLRREPERIGIEMEGSSVRIARVVADGEAGLRIESFGTLDIDLKHASEMEIHRFKSAIRQLGGGIQTVATCIEHPTLRIRKMLLPKMPEADLIEAIRWNFREQVEGAIDSYVVGYTLLEEGIESGKMPIMAYGISREAIKESVTLLKSFGLKPVSVEPAATALLTALHAGGILGDGRHHVCIAFGEYATQFVVMRGRSMLFSRPLAGINGESLTKLVMRNLNLEERNAREAIVAWMQRMGEESMGISMSDMTGLTEDEKRIVTTMSHFLSQLVIEVQRSIDAYCIMYGADRIDVIHVCGKGALYPGLVSHMRTTLGVETKVLNPFERLYPKERQTPEVIRYAPLYAVAVGLAIA